jgi:hypothetical protein
MAESVINVRDYKGIMKRRDLEIPGIGCIICTIST